MTEIGQEIALELSHRFAAPREKVFEAWTDPEVLRRWWAAAPTWDTPLAEVDLREGGSYRLSMHTDTAKCTPCAASTPRCDRRSASRTRGHGKRARSR